MASLKVQCDLGTRRRCGSERRVGCEVMRPEGDEREQAKQRRGGAQNGEVGPLALSFDAEMGAAFLEGDLQLPARDEPLEDIDGSGVEIGAEEGLRWSSPSGSRTSSHRIGTGGKPPWYQTAVPVASSTMRLVRPYQRATVWRCQTVLGSCSTWLSLARRLPLDRRSSAARTSGRCGGIKTGVEAQPGDDADIASDGGEELDGGKRGVADDDDAAARQPAVDLQSGLAGPVQQRLGRAWLAGIEALGRRKHGEKGQAHDAAGPRYVDQQLRGQPAQATGLDEVSLGGADRVTIDAAGADLVPPAPLDGVVDANDHGGIGAEEAGDQQAQQPACDRARRPHRPVQHAMVDREVVLLLPPEDPQCRGDGSFAGRQDGAGQQQQDVADQVGRVNSSGKPASRNSRRAGRGTRRMRGGIGLFHPMRRIDSAESQQDSDSAIRLRRIGTPPRAKSGNRHTVGHDRTRPDPD